MKKKSRYRINVLAITTRPLFQRLAQKYQQTIGNIKINQHDWLQKISTEKLVSDKPMVHEYIEV